LNRVEQGAKTMMLTRGHRFGSKGREEKLRDINHLMCEVDAALLVQVRISITQK
jgi:hypothetical protein